jgi:ArsR family transcriptional regulator, arsenate/arsenite/antimonite-responsive transcriptional repressor
MSNRKPASDPTARYADMFAALGTDCRLQILRALLAAHPDGMVVGDIQTGIGIPPSTLSHHLDRLKAEGLVTVRRESTFLRCFANTAALEELLGFLFSECCRRSTAVKAESVIQICGVGPKRRGT